MPQGFHFSEQTQGGASRIRAICGAKGLCFPDDKAWRTLKSSHLDWKAGNADLQERLLFVLDLIVRSENFKDAEAHFPLREEIDHFWCIAHSRVCRLLLIANPAVRWRHSYHSRRLLTGRPDRRTATGCVRYFCAATEFFWRAAPLVEASFLRRACVRENMIPQGPIRAEWEKLRAEGTNGNLPSREEVARRADLRFLFGSDGAARGGLLRWAKLGVRFGWLPLYVGWPHVLAIRRHRQLVFAAMMSLMSGSWRRVLRSGVRSVAGAAGTVALPRLPIVIAPNVWADPMVFLAKKSQHGGVDFNYGTRSKFRADVWWFVLRIGSEVFVLRRCHVADEEIRGLLVREVNFWLSWATATLGAMPADAAITATNATGVLIEGFLSDALLSVGAVVEVGEVLLKQILPVFAVYEREMELEPPTPRANAMFAVFDSAYIQV